MKSPEQLGQYQVICYTCNWCLIMRIDKISKKIFEKIS